MTQTRKLFISYSHVDANIVEPLTAILRAAGAVVFRDGDDIAPGELWRLSIANAIETAQSFLLFWCAHSSASTEVQRELARAIELKKRIIPILLDEEPLSPQLRKFQGINMRGLTDGHQRASAPINRDFRDKAMSSSATREPDFFIEGNRRYLENCGIYVAESVPTTTTVVQAALLLKRIRDRIVTIEKLRSSPDA
jgi:TIR domain